MGGNETSAIASDLRNVSERESMAVAGVDAENLTSLATNLSEEVSAQGSASWRGCAAESQHCSWWRHCCDNLQCENLLGGSGHVCVSRQPQCVQENGICGGPGQLTQSCCGNMQCKQLLGGSEMKCQQSQPSCVEENGICGGPGQLTQSCCGNMQCKQ